MTGPFFVDTNVLVYADDARDAAKRSAARALLRQLLLERSGKLSIQVLQEFFARGVRTLTLTWNNTNEWADGCGDEGRHGGLSPRGRQVVEAMEALGYWPARTWFVWAGVRVGGYWSYDTRRADIPAKGIPS